MASSNSWQLLALSLILIVPTLLVQDAESTPSLLSMVKNQRRIERQSSQNMHGSRRGSNQMLHQQGHGTGTQFGSTKNHNNNDIAGKKLSSRRNGNFLNLNGQLQNGHPFKTSGSNQRNLMANRRMGVGMIKNNGNGGVGDLTNGYDDYTDLPVQSRAKGFNKRLGNGFLQGQTPRIGGRMGAKLEPGQALRIGTGANSVNGPIGPFRNRMMRRKPIENNDNSDDNQSDQTQLDIIKDRNSRRKYVEENVQDYPSDDTAIKSNSVQKMPSDPTNSVSSKTGNNQNMNDVPSPKSSFSKRKQFISQWRINNSKNTNDEKKTAKQGNDDNEYSKNENIESLSSNLDTDSDQDSESDIYDRKSKQYDSKNSVTISGNERFDQDDYDLENENRVNFGRKKQKTKNLSLKKIPNNQDGSSDDEKQIKPEIDLNPTSNQPNN